MPETKISPLYINPDDTREMVEELIRKSESEKLLLIFTGHTSSSIDIIDLQLLSRMAQRNEKQLAVATRNAKLSDAADHLGIPLFRTPAQARRAEWQATGKPPIEIAKRSVDDRKKPQRYQPHTPTHPWWEWALSGLALLLVTAIGLLLFSRATITITPIPKTQSLPLEITASKTVRAANLTGEIPLRSYSLILESTTSGETSGVVSFPEGYASGTLTVTNLTGEDLNLPAGLTVQTVAVQPIQFFTNTALSLSPAGEEGDSDKVEITAKAPGRDGNVTAGEILAVAGEFGSSISVRNAGPMFGGYNRHVGTPSEKDIVSLRESLIEELMTEALTDYDEQMVTDGFILLPETIAIDEFLSEEVVPLTGEPADEFHLTLRVRFTADYLDPADLEETAEQLMDASIEDGYTANDGEPMITPVTAPQANQDGSYRWSVLFHRQIIPDLSELDLGSFAGQPPRKLHDWISSSFPYIENITITSRPGFWWWLPVFPQRMEVIGL